MRISDTFPPWHRPLIGMINVRSGGMGTPLRPVVLGPVGLRRAARRAQVPTQPA